jgi:hypothetical protein
MTRKGVEEPTHHQGPVNPVLYDTFDVSTSRVLKRLIELKVSVSMNSLWGLRKVIITCSRGILNS